MEDTEQVCCNSSIQLFKINIFSALSEAGMGASSNTLKKWSEQDSWFLDFLIPNEYMENPARGAYKCKKTCSELD